MLSACGSGNQLECSSCSAVCTLLSLWRLLSLGCHASQSCHLFKVELKACDLFEGLHLNGFTLGC